MNFRRDAETEENNMMCVKPTVSLPNERRAEKKSWPQYRNLYGGQSFTIGANSQSSRDFVTLPLHLDRDNPQAWRSTTRAALDIPAPCATKNISTGLR